MITLLAMEGERTLAFFTWGESPRAIFGVIWGESIAKPPVGYAEG
jgi:hypothetical protein